MNSAATAFEQFELDYDLFDLRIDEIPIWERLRFWVFREIERQNGTGQAHTDVGNEWRDYARGAGLFLKNLVDRNPYLADSSDVLYVGHHRRKKREDGYWWDIYCDPIHEACDHEYVHFEKDYMLQHHQPARTSNLRYLDLIEYGGTMQQILGLNEPRIPQAQRKRLEEAGDEIQERFDAQIDLSSMAREALHTRQTTLPLYRRLLEEVEPELVVLVVSYIWETFIEACKESGVPVVELQHGVIYNHHFGYSFPESRNKETFPDYLFTFGDFWKDAVEFPIPNERVLPVGYPFLEESLAQYEQVESTPQLLFISQGTIGNQLSKYAMQLDQHPEFKHDIVYKLHPGEYDRWEDEYPWLREANFEIIDSPDRQLYKLFAESSAQIGVGSTAVYEGLAFGLKTFVYDCPGSEVLQPLLAEGAAQLVSSPADLISSIGRTEKQFNRGYYFEPNATDRTCEELSRLLK